MHVKLQSLLLGLQLSAIIFGGTLVQVHAHICAGICSLINI